MRYYNKKMLYLECNAGISGDMTVAALLDLGADREVLSEVLRSLHLEGYHVEIGRVKKAGIDCCDFNVCLDDKYENHDHDMEYLHGHHGLRHDEVHSHHHEHGHGEVHSHEHHHGHHHDHRGMAEITEILNRAKMTEGARTLADKIFDILAEAEAKAHAVPKEEVHFHEVGAVDSIVDIVSAAVCIDNLGIKEVIIPKLCEGHGIVRCQHGVLAVPVPAVANIMKMYDLTVEFMDIQGEFVTPTGAAIAAAVKTGDKLPPGCRIRGIGLGAGKRNYERPSILRAMLIEDTEETSDTVYKLESNIDDCTGEALGYVMERLFAAGARDVNYMPVYMKKNRPGWQLNVICGEEDIECLEQIIFRETTTIGIRRIEMERTVLPRQFCEVETGYGEARVKVCQTQDETRYYPEYESVADISRKHQIPYMEVYYMIVDVCRKRED